VVVRYGRDRLMLEFGDVNEALAFIARDGGELEISLGDRQERVSAAWVGRDLRLITPRGRIKLHWIDPFLVHAGQTHAAGSIVAPMPGTVTRILAEPGTEVPRGTPLIVVEAMKMEHTLRAPADGRLKALKCAVGDVVQEGAELADFEPAGS
jgi:3-methylcrotonyl-CoA carboxylase alpha subunit